jgi:2-dehydro-3-deoxygluconokinase
MSGPFEVFCAGETMIMVAPLPGGRLDLDSKFILHAGGAESNVAASLAALGHRTAWAGLVGDDPFGDMVLEALLAASIDVSLAQRARAFPTGVYFKDPKESGRSLVHYYRSGSAASRMSPSVAAGWASVRTQVLHLSGVTSALSSDCRELMRWLILERPVAGAVVSFDVNFRETLWAANHAAAELLELAQASDLVFVGRDEAQTLWGTRSAEDIRDLLDKPSHLIVKDSELEAVAFHDNDVVRVAAPQVDVVEAVGAGDAFAAGWLSGYLDGAGAVTRLRMGHLVASRVLRSPTDLASLPNAGDIAAILQVDTTEWHLETDGMMS